MNSLRPMVGPRTVSPEFAILVADPSPPIGTTLLDAFERHVTRSPEKPANIFLGDGTHETARISFATLDARARSVAALLLRHELAGAPALLIYPPGIDFLPSLIGCFLAGAIAVPVPFPMPSRAWERVIAVARDARPKVVLTIAALAGATDSHAMSPELLDATWIATDVLQRERHDCTPSQAPAPEAVALVQYTSGSTSAPKGIAISHANLAHNEEMLRTLLCHSCDTIGVNWVPASHDMGLIGGLLQPLYCGMTCVVLPPLKVLQHPIRWLEAISRYRANTSTAPTFAYEFCTRRIPRERRHTLDLTCWDVAICGAEPVRADVLENFATAFASSGFSSSAFLPAYGLAEATLLSTGNTKGTGLLVREVDALRLVQNEVAPPRGGRSMRVVSCGTPHLGQEVAIVDPVTRRALPENCVGEIWLAGGSVGQGYWNRPDETEATFRAQLVDRNDRRYLRTGDLGFLGAEGLFVTGRLKEMVIVRGTNYYPLDIEEAVRLSHPALENGQGCAFGIEADGEEVVVIAFEPARVDAPGAGDGAVIEAAIAALAREFGLRLHDFVLLRPGSLPRTTSGKLQRHRVRDLYRSGVLPALGAPSNHPGLGRKRIRDASADAP